MRVVFLATGEIALPAFGALCASSHSIVGVVTQPDRPAGRKRELKAPEIKRAAAARGFPVFQPERVRRRDAIETIRAWNPEIGVVMAYGQILPRALLDLPRYGCLNLHASLLPRHRGAAPIQAAILAGDPTTGITVMYMDEGLDTGDILSRASLPIGPDETAGELHDRLGLLAGEIIVGALDAIATGSAPRTPQQEGDATYSPKLSREDARIEWSKPADLLAREVRAFHPWPGSHGQLEIAGGKPRGVKITRARALAGEGGPAGSRIGSDAGSLRLACGSGILEILELQPDGKRPMPADAFLRGAEVVRALPG